MTELHELSAGAQLDALRRRKVSSYELTRHYLERIERLDGRLGAFTTVCPEVSLTEAARADARLAAGEGDRLTGLPLAIKDLFATAGVRTTFGTRALSDTVPPTDDSTVARLRSAGVVLLGKTSAPEFGAACFTDGELTGRPSVTPYDLGRYASGAVGAVAARLLPLAHGSDSAGSIRTPPPPPPATSWASNPAEASSAPHHARRSSPQAQRGRSRARSTIW
ncbi:amidase family protein [Brevibacterium sediminis]|uniref:amidase family protein n=1 Tax=Brevibacterium sediminis TaxID=1857024 RepID=UPI0015E6DC2C